MSALLLWLTFGGITPVSAKEKLEVYPVKLYLFHATWCPHCKDELKYLKQLEKDFPNLIVLEFESSRDKKNKKLLETSARKYGVEKVAFPTTMIGEKHFIGFDNAEGMGEQLRREIVRCSFDKCSGWLDQQLDTENDAKIAIEEGKQANYVLSEKQEQDKSEEKVRIFGKEINLQDSSIFPLGVILGLADGVNPCMFSVLIFLLTYLLAIGSKKRAWKAGLVFVLTTFGLYFLFMLGILKVTEVLKIAFWVRWAVIGFALFAGLIMLKDFFFYGKWFSLEIGDSFKPKIKKLVQKGTVPSAFLLALLSGIAELPCTAGIPLAYTMALSKCQLNPCLPLIVYNFFFIVPSLLIVIAVNLTWTKIEAVEQKREKFKKWMRLVAGLLLVLLAAALYWEWL